MRLITAVVLAFTLAGPSMTEASTYAGDIVVGVDASGQLDVRFDVDSFPQLPLAGDLFDGWLSNEPGFVSLATDQPDEGFFALADGADLYVEIVAVFDDGLEFFDPSFAPLGVGESFPLGGPGFDENPYWAVRDKERPPSLFAHNIMQRVVDAGTTGYAASDPFVVTLNRVPSPAAAPLVLGAGLLLRDRRR